MADYSEDQWSLVELSIPQFTRWRGVYSMRLHWRLFYAPGVDIVFS